MTRWIAVWAIAIAVGLPVCAASAGITVDGAVSPADEWSATSPGSVTDLDETNITDDTVDISDAFISNGDDTTNLYFRWDFYAAPPNYTTTGGLVEYGFELYLPGNVTLYATNDPYFDTPDGTKFFLEDDTQSATSTGIYSVGTGTSDTVEANVPYSAFADLGITIPAGGLDVDYLAYIIEQTAQPDDDTCQGSFTIIVPEPASMTALVLGLGALGGYLRRRRMR